MTTVVHPLADAAARLLNARVTDCRQLAGAELSAVVRLTFADGRDVVAKSSRNGVEADMLRAMRMAGARVPEVLAADSEILVLSVADDTDSLSRWWSDLGTQLRILHSATDDSYGWPADYAFGSVTICNARSGGWIDFWTRHRLLCFTPFVPTDLARRIEALAAGLHDFIPARPRPCLLHGDLWGGNVLAGRDGVTLIDPACYYGDGAVDVAMLALFGRPENAFYRHYGCRPGSEILAVYGLWPALVHLRLFGRGYFDLVDRSLKKLGC